MKTEKYKLWGGGKMHGNDKVFRIQALSDFNDVKKGDLGGYISSKENLATDINDHSWVYDDSIVKGDGRVEKNSFVDDHSVVYHSRITNGSNISHGSTVGHSRIDGSSVQNSETFYANVKESNVSHEVEIRNARVVNSELGNGSSAIHSTMIDSSLVNGAKISKGAHLTNVHLDEEIVEHQKFEDYTTTKGIHLNEDDLEALDVYEDLLSEGKTSLSEDDLADLEDLDKSKGLSF